MQAHAKRGLCVYTRERLKLAWRAPVYKHKLPSNDGLHSSEVIPEPPSRDRRAPRANPFLSDEHRYITKKRRFLTETPSSWYLIYCCRRGSLRKAADFEALANTYLLPIFNQTIIRFFHLLDVHPPGSGLSWPAPGRMKTKWGYSVSHSFKSALNQYL